MICRLFHRERKLLEGDVVRKKLAERPGDRPCVFAEGLSVDCTGFDVLHFSQEFTKRIGEFVLKGGVGRTR